MEKTCSQRIVDYLNACNCWVSGDLLERKVQEAGYKASTGSRCARKLAETLKIERREDKKGFVWYAPLNTEKPPEYRAVPRIITRPDGSRAVVIEKVAV